MAFLAAGLSYSSCSLELLERAAVTDVPKALVALSHCEHLHEVAVLSTCNRVEVYATVHRFHPAVHEIQEWLAGHAKTAYDALPIYAHFDDDAVRHLFAVACGIDSMVLGESQILGQVREAYEIARHEGTARRMLAGLFQAALRAGKRARSQTAISRAVVSLPQAAARAAGDVTGRKVVVVGTGEMAEQAAVSAQAMSAGQIVVVGRSAANARRLASRLGVSAAPFGELRGVLDGAAACITCVTSPEPVVGVEHLRGLTLCVVDLGLPRNVDPAAAGLEGITLIDLDDLSGRVAEGAALRRAQVPEVEAILEDEVRRFEAWERSQALAPTITALRRWADELRSAEVRRACKGEQIEVVDEVTRALVNKLLHRPITRVKELAAADERRDVLAIFQDLFDLPGDL